MGRSAVGRFVLFALIGMLITSGALAFEADHIVSNSENWEDVYSTMLYSSLNGIGGDFLTSTKHGPILLSSISTGKEVLVVTSKDEPFVFNYDSQIKARGFEDAEEIKVDSANLELVKEMKDTNNFIVVGNSYGYNAVAVTPYAIQTDSWVFLANRVNIAEIESILNRRDIGQLLVYGYMDREVKEALEKFNPVVIDNGNRFEDNVEIVEKFKATDNAKQVLLSNGEFIEREIMHGKHPILFTGKENVPEQIADYLKTSDIEVGVLIGNELINAATNIRRSTGISVMVKFAQGARAQTAGISAVEGLDLFYLPTPTLKLDIYSVKYNKASSQIEVTYQSKSNVPIYVKGTLTASSDDDDIKMGDTEPVFIAPSDYKTLVYPDVKLEGTGLKANIFVLFGEVSDSLDRMIEGEFDMGIINVIDKCEVEINSVHYNKQAKKFYVTVKDKSKVDCFVDIELTDVSINGIEQTIGTEGSVLVKGGKKTKIEIKQRMNNDDLYDNQFVNAVAYFGEREETLIKVFRGKFELNVDNLTGTTWAIILVLILIIVIGLVLWKRKRDDEW
ncbi:hypothetical protein KAS08_04365 [Candidatus Pacearchaeota archaeon]|nr:hypothetical protein [Candidatus Pacearchaeota archaeon]